jgi:two-component system, chemotaxis family, CheB/CheR fusion protein
MEPELSEQEAQQAPGQIVSATPKLLVVGIGASAGGLQALQRLFTHMPADSGLAFVVILHLSPEHESYAASVIQQATVIPVTQVTETVSIVPNHIYVIPPNKYLSMVDDALHPSQLGEPHGRRALIDLFFRTLAETHGRNAAAIVLSGGGADGALGVQRIKEYGGVVLAQEPQEAEFDSMPRHTIATGLVDFILPVAEMPTSLIEYWSSTEAIQLPALDVPHQGSDAG